MNEIPTPTPEPADKKNRWTKLLEHYRQELQNIPTSTLELTPEELATLSPKNQGDYQRASLLFDMKQEKNGEQGYRRNLLSRVVEEVLSRHNALSHGWITREGNIVRAIPRIFKTAKPDDSKGIDFVFSFSDNITCAVDITLASKISASGQRKLERRLKYEETLKQAHLQYWRLPDGSIEEKVSPFLPVFINGPSAEKFIRDSARYLDEPLGHEYQNVYRSFFETVMTSAAKEAESMKNNILETILTKGHLPLDVIANIQTVFEMPSPEKQKTLALQNITNSLHRPDQQKTIALLMQYHIIQRFSNIVRSDVRKK